jgi:photosystem II stability/assembly factor-like uncharacterized protein
VPYDLDVDLDLIPVAELEDLEVVASHETRRRGRAMRPLAWSLVVFIAIVAACARPLGTSAGTALPHAATPVHARLPDLREFAARDFIAISFVDGTHGFGIEQLSTATGIDSVYARFVATVDGGATWSSVGAPVLNAQDIAFVDAMHGVVATGPHAALATNDGGKTWSVTNVALGSVQAAHGSLWGVTACDRDEGEWCNVTIEQSLDGGQTWQHRTPPCGPTTEASLAAVDANIVWISCIGGAALAKSPSFDCADCGPPLVVGGTLSLYRSLDGGQTWRRLPKLPATRVFDAQLLASSANDATLDLDTGYFTTRDGGRSWHAVWES